MVAEFDLSLVQSILAVNLRFKRYDAAGLRCPTAGIENPFIHPVFEPNQSLRYSVRCYNQSQNVLRAHSRYLQRPI